jgi:hypothetical protein
MRRRGSFRPLHGAILWSFAAFVLGASIQAQQPASVNPLERISWLVGKWTAALPPTDGTPLLGELVAQWGANHDSIEITSTRIPAGKIPVPEYQSTFAWDPGAKQITVKQTYANGDRFEGMGIPVGINFQASGHLLRANGSMQDLRMVFDAWSPDTFNMEVTASGSNSATPAQSLQLVYLRQKNSDNITASGNRPARLNDVAKAILARN